MVPVGSAQLGCTAVRIGAIGCELTVTEIEAVVAHASVDVNIEVVVPTVAVLIVAGLHDPVKLFSEVPGSAGAILF